MRCKFSLLLVLLLFSIGANAQETHSAAESVEKLKLQLLEVEVKETVLRSRAEQLEESLKPENIERSLAGVGSTRPEELRETRRRQLTIERDGVLAQLKTVETSKSRLEAAVATAEGLAYQQSARSDQMLAISAPRKSQWILFGGGGLAALLAGAGFVLYRRRTKLG